MAQTGTGKKKPINIRKHRVVWAWRDVADNTPRIPDLKYCMKSGEINSQAGLTHPFSRYTTTHTFHYMRTEKFQPLADREKLVTSQSCACRFIYCTVNKVKPFRYRQADTQEERKYGSYLFLTSVLGGMSGQRHAPAAL
jgi:hypothetical protein